MWEWPTYVLSSPVFVFFSYVHLRYYRKKKRKKKEKKKKKMDIGNVMNISPIFTEGLPDDEVSEGMYHDLYSLPSDWRNFI